MASSFSCIWSEPSPLKPEMSGPMSSVVRRIGLVLLYRGRFKLTDECWNSEMLPPLPDYCLNPDATSGFILTCHRISRQRLQSWVNGQDLRSVIQTGAIGQDAQPLVPFTYVRTKLYSKGLTWYQWADFILGREPSTKIRTRVSAIR
jgi:hypothetical protein